MLSIKLVTGELLHDTEWASIPNNEVIRYMDYKIWNMTIRLMGYERYLHLKEIVKGINVSFKGIRKIILVGQTGINCTRVTIDLFNKRYIKEDVIFDEVYNGKPIDNKFWKAGQILDNPNVYINNI